MTSEQISMMRRANRATFDDPRQLTVAGAAIFALAVLAILWVALYNGYPLVWWDSGAYLESSVLLNVPVARPVFYPLFMHLAGSRHTLWGVVLLQSALLVYLVRQALIACAHAAMTPQRLDRALVVVIAVLAFATALPWIAGEVMPDVFAGATVLSLFLILGGERRSVRAVLVEVLFLVSLVVHFTHIPLAAGLLVVAGVASRVGWSVPVVGFRRAIVCVLLAIVLMPATNRVLTGRWFVSDATPIMLLDRLLAQGIPQKLLAERCPGASYALCAYQSDLPEIPGRYLWDPASPFTRIGGWQSGAEASRLVRDTIREYPVLLLRRSAEAFVSQLTRFATFADAERFGEGTGIDYEVATWIPREHARYLRSRQQQGRLQTAAFRALHLWVGLLSVPPVAYLALVTRRKRPKEAVLHLLCIAAVAVNAAVIAAAGSPDDRYAARLMWLPTLSLLISLARDKSGQLPSGSYLASAVRRS